MFDFVFVPFQPRNPMYAIVVFSVLTGLLMVAAFRYTSDQPGIRRIKQRIGAHILEVRLFQDQLSVIWRAYARILRAMLSYLGYSLKPLAVMLIPLLILLLQLDLRLGRRPVETEETTLIEVQLEDASALGEVSLLVPEGLVVTAPALHIETENEVDWRVQARRTGKYEVEVEVRGERLQKRLLVSTELERVSAERVQSGFFGAWLFPGEAPLPPGPVKAIRVKYPAREVSVAGWKMHWLIPFFVFALIASYATKGVFGAEF